MSQKMFFRNSDWKSMSVFVTKSGNSLKNGSQLAALESNKVLGRLVFTRFRSVITDSRIMCFSSAKILSWKVDLVVCFRFLRCGGHVFDVRCLFNADDDSRLMFGLDRFFSLAFSA